MDDDDDGQGKRALVINTYQEYVSWKMYWRQDCLDKDLKELIMKSSLSKEIFIQSLVQEIRTNKDFQNWSILLMYVPQLLDELSDYCLLWIIECLRLMGKRVSGPKNGINALYASVLLRIHDINNSVYKLRATSAILRISSVEHLSVLSSLIKGLLFNCKSVKKVINWIDSDYPVKLQPRDMLNLVGLSDFSPAKIFLMNLIIYSLRCLLADLGCLSQLSILTTKRGVELPSKEKWDILLIFLFDDHEGLLFKMLYLLLQIELKYPNLFIPSKLDSSSKEELSSLFVFGSVSLYKALVSRLHYSNINMIHSIKCNFSRTTLYLLAFYKSIEKHQLLGFEQIIIDDEIASFHNDLLKSLKEAEMATPIQRVLQKIILYNSK